MTRVLALIIAGIVLGCSQAPPPPSTPVAVIGAPPLSPDFPIPRQAITYRNYLIQTARYYWGLEADVSVFFGQVHAESAWNDAALSHAGAQGLAQFMPGTARDMQRSAELREFCVSSQGCPFEPKWALRAMVLYDHELWDRCPWSATVLERWGFTLAGYNGGAGWWARERSACSQGEGCDSTIWFNHVERYCLRDATKCTENRQYPRRILSRWAPGYRAWLAR